MRRVLIANRCGLLSALPTVAEYLKLDFQDNAERFVIGAVEVAPDVAADVYQERSRVRVLTPELPTPVEEPGWLYVAVLNGELIKVEPS